MRDRHMGVVARHMGIVGVRQITVERVVRLGLGLVVMIVVVVMGGKIPRLGR